EPMSITLSASRVMRVFRGSVFRVQGEPLISLRLQEIVRRKFSYSTRKNVIILRERQETVKVTLP
ncbi:MAG: hypothetical protein AB1512_24090, partial [Thermodesulfobacteriota bacterium]